MIHKVGQFTVVDIERILVGTGNNGFESKIKDLRESDGCGHTRDADAQAKSIKGVPPTIATVLIENKLSHKDQKSDVFVRQENSRWYQIAREAGILPTLSLRQK